LIDLTKKPQEIGKGHWVRIVVAITKVDIESEYPEVNMDGTPEGRAHEVNAGAYVNIDMDCADP
jgi:hypothetical protein